MVKEHLSLEASLGLKCVTLLHMPQPLLEAQTELSTLADPKSSGYDNAALREQSVPSLHTAHLPACHCPETFTQR